MEKLEKANDNHLVHAGFGKLPLLLLLLYLTLPLWAGWYFFSHLNTSPMSMMDRETAKAVEIGRKIAAEQGCFACHGPDGKGGVENPGHTDGFVPGWNSKDLVSTKMYFPIILRQEIEKAVIPSMFQNPTDIGTQEYAPFKMQPWLGRLTTQQINYIMAYIYSINPFLQDKIRLILRGTINQKEFNQVSGDINPAYVGDEFGEVTTVSKIPLGTPTVAQFPPDKNYPDKYDQYYQLKKDAIPPQWVNDLRNFAQLINLQY